MDQNSYQIKLEQFEGPFDLLLFFIERDELDIYNINITKIINDFLDYIHEQEKLNIDLSSEFILFISTLMRIKAKMLIPRKELDAAGNEIDPRQELVDKILEYRKFKEAAMNLATLEDDRLKMAKRGNLQKELYTIGEESSEGTEIQNITLYKLMKAFDKVMLRMQERMNKPIHTVVQYNYTMEESRATVTNIVRSEKTVAFEKLFSSCENKLHAIFLFLSLLEMVQQKMMFLLLGQGMNNFIVEWNEAYRETEIQEENN
ncbi:MAG: segregation/condensation protein A [Bacteroidetes bacterium]|nr:segregation/condensation protein A [Bacteroidota bacterium]